MSLDESCENQPQSRLKTIVHFLLGQWLLIGIGVVCALAYCFPNVAKHGGIIQAQYSILYGAVALIFLVSGLSIPGEKLAIHGLNWRLHLLVQGFSFLIFPAIVLLVVYAILASDPIGKIDRGVLAGYILTACLPTTIASNVVMTKAAGGDDAAALVEVLIANVLGPFISASWTSVLIPHTQAFSPWQSSSGDLSHMYREVFQQLGTSVLAALAVGQIIRWRWNDFTVRLLQNLHLAKVSTACLLLLIWSSFSTCFATDVFTMITSECIIFVVFFNILLYLFMTGLCFALCRITGALRLSLFPKFDPEITIAICFCGPAKTTGLGIPLLYAMWGSLELGLQAKSSLPLLLYTTEQICVAHFLVYLFRRWKSSNNAVDLERSDIL